MTKIKICGITCSRDVDYINEFKPEFAGFVMFFPKSRRNISPEKAAELLNMLDGLVKSVAVMVSPTLEQIETAYKCGFDYVQIHGEVENALLINSPLPVLRAFNVKDIDSFEKFSGIDNIKGYVFDAQMPGSGKTFDWKIIEKISRDGKTLILAGGLNPENVADAIKAVNPDCVDVSSGVENNNRIGKNREKIALFTDIVRKLQNSDCWSGDFENIDL